MDQMTEIEIEIETERKKEREIAPVDGYTTRHKLNIMGLGVCVCVMSASSVTLKSSR